MNAQHINKAAVNALNTTIDAAAAFAVADSGFSESLSAMFGAARARDLTNDNAAAQDAANAVCRKEQRLLSTGHWTYDRNNHLAALALYRAAIMRSSRSAGQ